MTADTGPRKGDDRKTSAENRLKPMSVRAAAERLLTVASIPWFDDAVVPEAQLEARIRQLVESSPEKAIILKGDQGEAPLDTFLPSADRRVLAQFPQRHMLLARARPGGGWAALGIADFDYERIVRRILQHAGSWRPMQTDNRERLAVFIPLLGHENPRLHEMAYLEIARTPYAEIRRIATEVPIETTRGMLDNPQYLEWHSLAILLLAQSEHPADKERIRTTFADKQRLGSRINLAAWATAYLAIEGAGGLDDIQRWYLTRPDRSREELRAIVKALSVIAGAEAPMRAASSLSGSARGARRGMERGTCATSASSACSCSEIVSAPPMVCLSNRAG